MKRLHIVTLFGVMLATPLAAQSLSGTYSVAGTNLDGSPYGGSAEVVWTSDTSCEIVWTTGSTTSQGICMRSGTVFAAGYVLGDKIGMVIYRIQSGGVLDGLWTVSGTDGAGTEVLTPQ